MATSQRWRLAGWMGLGVAVMAWWGAAGSAHPVDAPQPAEAKSSEELAATIDRILAARWHEGQLKPAPVADDAEFMRRVYLDLIGKIPPVNEVRDFMADPAADKR